MNCPLSKELCSKNKCYHITDITKDGVKELNLCKDCGEDTYKEFLTKAKKDSQDIPDVKVIGTENPIQELISLIANIAKENKPVQKEVIFSNNNATVKLCPNCNCSILDIVKSSRIGCPKCYETFRPELLLSIMRVQGSLEHKGKVPKTNLPKNLIIRDLEKKLKLAIQEERYEDASSFKKHLESLNKEEINDEIKNEKDSS